MGKPTQTKTLLGFTHSLAMVAFFTDSVFLSHDGTTSRHCHFAQPTLVLSDNGEVLSSLWKSIASVLGVRRWSSTIRSSDWKWDLS